jgi:hypothetical protein
MSFTEDLSVFFNNADFADTVTVIATGRTFQGIFDAAYFDPEVGAAVVDSTDPRITCKTSDLANVERGRQISIKGATYSVVSVQPDGTGTSIVMLSNQVPR